MVESVGDVEGELVVELAAGGPFLHGAVDVDDEVAAPACIFAGDGVVAETDDVGGAVLAKVFAVGPGDAFVVDQYDGDFAPCSGRGLDLEFPTQPISQLLEILPMDRMVFLLVE